MPMQECGRFSLRLCTGLHNVRRDAATISGFFFVNKSPIYGFLIAIDWVEQYFDCLDFVSNRFDSHLLYGHGVKSVCDNEAIAIIVGAQCVWKLINFDRLMIQLRKKTGQNMVL